MTTSVCTLFEGDYHKGVATLANSLVRGGFSGRIYAGYRGPLPIWALAAKSMPLRQWPEARVLPIGDVSQLVFLPMQTQAHFTNIKPDFMLQLFAEESFDVEKVLYLDPDICVVERWQYRADGLSSGIALCEDVNSPLSEHDPRRIGWRRYFAQYGMPLQFRSTAYVNGGCVGVARGDRGFLENWQRLSAHMADSIGGLGTAKVEGGGKFHQVGFASCFDCSDQDALNAAVEMTDGMQYSILSRAAMGFFPGALVMPHALGPRKPWRRRYLREALSALAPSVADKAFWMNADGPLHALPAARIRWTRIALGLASAISRVYSRR